jgi:hypothetical protein
MSWRLPLFNEPFVAVSVECQYCKTKQKVHIADKPGVAQILEQRIPCINCERLFEVRVSNRVTAGPFPVRRTEAIRPRQQSVLPEGRTRLGAITPHRSEARKPRLVLTNRMQGSAVGYECVALGCTWRSPKTLKHEAECAFAKHLEKAHPNEPVEKK